MQVLEVEAMPAAADGIAGCGPGRLDFDHLRAPVGELAHGRWTGTVLCEVDDAQVGERSCNRPRRGLCRRAWHAHLPGRSHGERRATISAHPPRASRALAGARDRCWRDRACEEERAVRRTLLYKGTKAKGAARPSCQAL